MGLVAGDPLSYIRGESNFQPIRPMARDDGSFDMAPLIRSPKQPGVYGQFFMADCRRADSSARIPKVRWQPEHFGGSFGRIR